MYSSFLTFRFRKKWFLQKRIALEGELLYILCSLLFGFLVGNLFGTFLNKLREFFFWDGLILLLLVLFIEFISCATYKAGKLHTTMFCTQPVQQKSTDNSLFIDNFPKKSKRKRASIIDKKKSFYFYRTQKGVLSIRTQIWRFINFFKIGLMVGFFVDAFKVGS